MPAYTESGNPDDIALGRALIASGKVGCIVLAGGDGSRLGWDGPKGTFPLSLVKQKTLFQMLQEKVDAASHHFEIPLPLAIMTSPLNREITEKAFENYPGQVDFFTQNMAPILDENKTPLSEKRPNGNGEVLKCFTKAGLYEKWKKQGIEYLSLILIDNPLADPFDPNLIGLHAKKKADVTLKAIHRTSPEEKMGVIGQKEGRLCIVEYSENPPKEWTLANTSLFSFSLDFVAKTEDAPLPVHFAKKFLGKEIIYKQEHFLFDLLPFAEQPQVLVYPREEIFAPLKSREDVGPVQRALLSRDQHSFARLTGHPPSEEIFELSAHFHYPTPELIEKWKERPLPSTSYVEP